MSIYEELKNNLNVKDTARYYGLEVNRSDYVSCLFHNERTPSMKLYEHNYHCFGCGEHGDVINLTSALFNLLPNEAAEKLSKDFCINADYRNMKRASLIEKVKHQTYMARENRAFLIISDYCDYLEDCRKKYEPKNHDEILHPLFIKSLTELDKYRYYRDFMSCGDREKRKQFITDIFNELNDIEKLIIKPQKRKEFEK